MSLQLRMTGKRERMRDERRLLQHERETLFFLDSLQWSIVWGEDTRKRTWNRLRRRDMKRDMKRDERQRRERSLRPSFIHSILQSKQRSFYRFPLFPLFPLFLSESSVESSFPSCPLLTDSSSFFLSFTLLKSQPALIKRLETCSTLSPVLLSSSSSLPSFSQPSVLMTQVNCSPAPSSPLVSLMKLRQQQDWSKKTDIKNWQRRVTPKVRKKASDLSGNSRDNNETTFGLIHDFILKIRQLLSWPFNSQALHCVDL